MLAALSLGGFLAPSAVAQDAGPVQPLQIIANSPAAKPPGFQVTAGTAANVAARVPEVRRELAKGPLQRLVAVPGYTDDRIRWQVTYSRDGVRGRRGARRRAHGPRARGLDRAAG